MRTITGTLTDGLTIQGETYRDFEMREALGRDLFDAESEVGTERQLAFDAALAARQITRLGALKGPLKFEDMQAMTSRDLMIIRRTQASLNLQAETDEGNGGGATFAP